MPKVKELLVLSECVDSRSGKRFQKGEFFEPVPTGEQAARLFKAGCLPEGAVKLGQAEDARLAKKAEADAALAEKVAQRNADIAAAVNADAAAKLALEAAETKLAAAVTDADKAEAANQHKLAQEAAADAAEKLAKAQK